MAKKIKNQRSFTFKCYEVENSKNLQILTNAHIGEFIFKSECHYYAEKYILDFINNNIEQILKEPKIYLIYKISTIEDSKIEDMLIEQITVKDNKICID